MSEQKKEDFVCPICGSKKYSEKIQYNYVKCYICDGCSVIFSDPEKFSNADKFRTTKASA